MREIKISKSREKEFQLQGVPEESLFILSIAKRYADTQEELTDYYLAGVSAATDFKGRGDNHKYEAHVAWVVEQEIKRKKGRKI